MSRLTRGENGLAFRDRFRQSPAPALRWAAVALVLVALEAGAVLVVFAKAVIAVAVAIPGNPLVTPLSGFEAACQSIPTLLSRTLVSNTGYQTASGWHGTFLGLSPAVAWAIRVGLTAGYSVVVLAWAWRGYTVYRGEYRLADWTPRDDIVDRFRTHTWGKFGLVMVTVFVVMAVFAPTLGPTTVQRNIQNPYQNKITYTSNGQVQHVYVGTANQASQSRGTPQQNVGVLQYDQYGRFHPFGTLPSGKDLFTFVVNGARVSLVIGILAILLASFVATLLAMASAYYKGGVDLGLVVLSDATLALPQLLVLVLLSVVLSKTWVAQLYDGALILAFIFAFTGWPHLWRSVRGPALQVSEREWVEAARGYGLHPLTVMRKHILPYVTGYLLVYASMTLGGAIIAVAGLSFLGLGVNPPTPEWGRAIEAGQPYVTTVSWHISLIPGLLITLVVTGFNALGDGVRDAIDPQSDAATDVAVGRGGGA